MKSNDDSTLHKHLRTRNSPSRNYDDDLLIISLHTIALTLFSDQVLYQKGSIQQAYSSITVDRTPSDIY